MNYLEEFDYEVATELKEKKTDVPEGAEVQFNGFPCNGNNPETYKSI